MKVEVLREKSESKQTEVGRLPWLGALVRKARVSKLHNLGGSSEFDQGVEYVCRLACIVQVVARSSKGETR